MRGSTGAAILGAVLAIVSGVEILTHGPLTRIDNDVARHYFWPAYKTMLAQNKPSDSLQSFALILNDLGKPLLACLIVGLMAVTLSWLRRQSGPVLAMLVGLGGVGFSTLFLKQVFPHPSVFLHLPGSFPSGHTGVAVVAAGILVYLVLPERRWRYTVALSLAAGWGALMAWGRLIIEAHWLSDVIAGWGIGMCVLVLALRTADSPLGTREWRRSTPVDTQ